MDIREVVVDRDRARAVSESILNKSHENMIKYHQRKVISDSDDVNGESIEIIGTPEEEVQMILDYVNTQQNSKYFSALDKCALYGLYYTRLSNEQLSDI